VKPARWTEAELARIRDLRARGVRHSQVVDHAHEVPGRRPLAVRQMYGVMFSRPRVRNAELARRSESVRDLKRIFKARPVADVIADHDTIAAHDRPVTRADCLPGGVNEARPCPFVGCKHHVYLDVRERNGSVGFPHGDREVWEIAETCALDMADRDTEMGVDREAEHALQAIGKALGLTRERVRQIILRAIAKATCGVDGLTAQQVVEALHSFADRDPDARTVDLDAPSPIASIPRVVRHLPVVQDRPPPVRAVLDPETRALAATFASLTSPRTWLRRAAAKRSP